MEGVSGTSGDLYVTLRRITGALHSAGVSFMLVGALAAFAWGQPRTTRDLDIVADTRGPDETRVRSALEAAGFMVEGPVPGEFGRRFRLTGGTLPAEVFLSAGTPLQKREFQRARMVRFGDREYPVISPEDLVIRKLVNLRVRKKTTDLDDLQSVLFKQWETFDAQYLRDNCAPHRVCGAYEELWAAVRERRASAGMRT
jgi:hypothetical protein